MVASSLMLPAVFGFASLHCFAVIPNNATLSRSALIAWGAGIDNPGLRHGSFLFQGDGERACVGEW